MELTAVTLWYRPPEILLGKKRYSGAADVWGIGCIMAEMATKVPLFTGDSEIDQLFQIYRVMGTPTPKIWPGIDKLPDYQPVGPEWREKDLAQHLQHKLDAQGIDLLKSTLIYPPNKRITCKQMLLHQWFDEIREEMKELFGPGFPHCGSPKYQKALHYKRLGIDIDGSQNQNDCKQHDDDSDDDEDYAADEDAQNAEDDDVEDDDDVDLANAHNANRWRGQKRGQAMDQD